MREVGVRELKEQVSAVLRRVRERGETIAIAYRGQTIAWLVPVKGPRARRARAAKVWADMDGLAREISAKWPAGVSAAEAVSEQRR
jgi:antitoxin (DNA-binding transcriptional repressor) of toxin-antitoxin stability system